MSSFSIRNPYFIIVLCLALAVLGVTAIVRMPVDLFPPINIPVVVVATFYNGMPPVDIETDITNPLERFFTQASGLDHTESRSLLGVSIIKAVFQPGTNADADVTQLSNLALADLKRLPPGTLPPLVLKFDASSLPVALLTVKGEGLTETQLHDLAQFQIRNQITVVNGAEIPAVFGGKYRQAMVYVDPYKLMSRQLSLMDVVGAVNDSNLILPAGDVKIGPTDYYVYSNSLVKNVTDLNSLPIKTVGSSWVSVGDVGEAKDSSQLQYNIVRIDGQKSAYIPIMKAGGDSNTIDVVNGVRNLKAHLFGLPPNLVTDIVFDQSVFVKEAIKTVWHEGGTGLILIGIIILVFLGSGRATFAVLLSIPISTLAAFVVLSLMGVTINTMILAGLALAFSRVIDNSVISLENIYRHLEMGSTPVAAATMGGAEVNMAVLAATLVDVVDFFPVTLLIGVSKFLFSALALSFVLAMLASYVVAMTVIPLFCARFLKAVPHGGEGHEGSGGNWFNAAFNRGFNRILDVYERAVRRCLKHPGVTVAALVGVFVASLGIYPFVGRAFFPQTDAGQFTANIKVPTGTRIEVTNDYVARIEDMIRGVVDPKDLKMVLSNIGVVNDISSLYTTNQGQYTATIQVALNDEHSVSSLEYMDRVREKLAADFPDVRAFFQSGSLQDAVLNQGMPAPIDVQVNTRDLNLTYNTAQDLAARIRRLPGVGQIYIPQDMNYPSVRMDIDRVHAGELGLSQKDVVDNVITALNSNIMIAPNYWVDYQTFNDYFLSVQYAEHGKGAIHNLTDLKEIPLRAPNLKQPTTLDSVVKLVNVQAPTEVDHYQTQRVADVYVTPQGEDLAKLTSEVQKTIADAKLPANIRVNLLGMVKGMNDSFSSFGEGMGLSVVLLFLILVAQFRSWVDPILIMLAIPMSFVGVLIILPLTHTTLNVMSLVGVLMLIGIADSNSILIVDFAHKLEEQGMSVADAVITACRVRLRPILMTSLATIIGLSPMALKLGTGGEQYTPMARAIIGGLTSSVLLTIFIVPAAYLLVYGRKKTNGPAPQDSAPQSSSFSIRHPFFIIVLCLALAVLGVTAIVRMPVDLFPPINIPVVEVATFYNGMPPVDIETDITNPLERFFTQASGLDHTESRSLLGVSIIKAVFQPGTNADADVTQLSNLALADLKRLPPGTLPPLVLKFDASSLPVALLTVKGEGLTETQLHDLAQFQIRNQITVVNGAEIPAVFGGKYRQAMVYVDPYKLMSRQLSLMDVVSAVNNSNLILPAGDVKIGPTDYYVYSNSLVKNVTDLNSLPIKTVGSSWVSVGDVGEAKDSSQLQYNIVRIDGQKSAYIPIMKAGGDSNTIDVVNGVRNLKAHLFGLPPNLVTDIVFDQSVFVKEAIKTVWHEGGTGLILIGIIILVFLGSGRATFAVLLSIPISTLAAFVVLSLMGVTINTMILAGLALAFSRVIDNSVISLENIYRHLEMGSTPVAAATMGGAEVNLAVLAATLVSVVNFFPVTLLIGVNKFLFSALALSFVLAMLASYVVAMTVIPLFCARFLKAVPHGGEGHEASGGNWFNAAFNRGFNHVLNVYERAVRRCLKHPGLTVAALVGVFVASLGIYPFVGRAFFPQTDAGQFTANIKVPTGTRIELTNDYVARIEDMIRGVVDPKDLKMVLSNIGVVNDISSLYTTNQGQYTATIQVALNDEHSVSSLEYMDRVREKLAADFPDVRAFFQSGSLQDAVLNQGMPAPIDVQVNTRDLNLTYNTAQDLAARIRRLPGVGQIYIPQDMNYPSVRMDIDRVHAGELGLSQKDVVDNVITALNSNIMIAPNYWVDYQTFNDYFLSVQYAEHGKGAIHNLVDLKEIPLRAPNMKQPTTLDSVVKLVNVQAPTEIDHYQTQRVADVYVTPQGEDLAKLTSEVQKTIADAKLPANIRVNLLGMVRGMNDAISSFGKGMGLSIVLLFLILVAQFRSWVDPLLIMLAIPMGFVGVLIILPLTHTTLNVMSLVGVLMLIGISGSNSILIVDFAHKLEEQGHSAADAVITACRVRLRPILMTSLATIIGLSPMALKLGTGGEQYTPMARAIIGGLTSSVLLTIFIVPAAYLLVYGRKKTNAPANE